jgi:dihydroflavonol-4-reductase
VSPRLAPGDPVAVTGATGFIGSALVRELLAAGAHVVAVVDPAADRANLQSPELDSVALEVRPADVRDAGAVHDAIAGCRFVVHTAAVYDFWAAQPSVFFDVNVGGTRNVLAAVARSRCERLVYTSTVATLGLGGTAAGVPATEESTCDIAHLYGHYKRSKYVAEHEVLRSGAAGLDVVLVLPTFPVGPRDRRPTPTGRVVLDFLRGRMPAVVDTSFNVAHVPDAARGHLLALEHGTAGRSYIVGGNNVSMRQLLALLATATGLPEPTRRVPGSLVLAAGALSEVIEGRLLHRTPTVPLEAARMSATHMIFDDSRARNELGYRSRPASEAVADAVEWFVANGYIDPDRVVEMRALTKRR